MIEYDYILERNEGDEIRIFKPNEKIGKKLPNLVLIEAPNDSGKSTLLNMIAVGFYGLRNSMNKNPKKAINPENIIPSLIEDMRHLVCDENQKLEFKIAIDTPDGEILITEKKKDKKEPVVYREKNGKRFPIAPERFNKEYRLIYDIPDRPRERLKEIIDELDRLYRDIAVHIGDFRDYLNNTLIEIKKYRDPEQIAKLEERIKKYKDYITKEEEKYKGKKALLGELEKYGALRFFVKYYIKYEEIKVRINKIKKSQKKVNKKKKEYEMILNNINSLIKNILESKDKIIKYINEWKYPELEPEKYKLEDAVSRISDIDSISDINNRIFVEQTLRRIERIVNDIIDEREKILKKEFVELEIIKKLLEVLREYLSYGDIEVPGTSKTLNDYFEELKKEFSAKETVQKEYETLKGIEKEISNILYILNKSIPLIISNLKKLGIQYKELSEVEEYKDSTSIDELEKTKESIENKLEEYSIKCKKYGFDDIKDIHSEIYKLEKEDYIKEYADLNEKEFIREIKELKKSIQKSYENIIMYKALLDSEKKKYEKLKTLPEHKYLKDREKIEKLLTVVQKIERKFKRTFPTYNSKLKSLDLKILKDDETFYRYNDHIGKYLGKKLKVIKYVDNQYEVEKIDLLMNTLYLKGGKIINMKFLGTGHTQEAYINTILSKDDPRKIIALFDEISEMDEDTLSSVIQKIRELYFEGKLIACVMVQKRDKEVVVKDLEKEGY